MGVIGEWAALLAQAVPTEFRWGSTLPGSHFLYLLHWCRMMIVLTLVWHRMSDGSESGEKISRTISAGALLVAVPTRHAVARVR
jgi:hypothetical protein